MTDTPLNLLNPIGPGPEYRDKSIWLPLLYLESSQAGGHVIEDRTFIDCVLQGPAVLIPVGGCRFEDSFLGQHGGQPDSLLLNPMSPNQVVGPIPFRNCRFERCSFLGVGFTGDAAFLSQIAEVMGSQSA